MKYKFILFSPWLLKSPGSGFRVQGSGLGTVSVSTKPSAVNGLSLLPYFTPL